MKKNLDYDEKNDKFFEYIFSEYRKFVIMIVEISL